MTRVHHTTVYRGPRSIIVKKGCSLEDKLLYLDQTKHSLESLQNLPELYKRILDLAFKNFSAVGKSVVYAGFWSRDKFTALTIPKHLPPFPWNAGPYVKIGGEVKYPFQPELIQEAIKEKDIVPGNSKKEKFLAIPLVTEDKNAVLGILLLSNRLSKGKEQITEDDIEVARTFGKVVSEALSRFA